MYQNKRKGKGALAKTLRAVAVEAGAEVLQSVGMPRAAARRLAARSVYQGSGQAFADKLNAYKNRKNKKKKSTRGVDRYGGAW